MDLRPESVRADVEASLARLRRERLDLVQFHDVDRDTPIEESWGELQRLIAEGKVRHGGISNHPVDAIERALSRRAGRGAAVPVQPAAPDQDQRRPPVGRGAGDRRPDAGRRWPAGSSPTGSTRGARPGRLPPEPPFAKLDLGALGRPCDASAGGRTHRRPGRPRLGAPAPRDRRRDRRDQERAGGEQLPGAAGLRLDPADMEEIEGAVP